MKLPENIKIIDGVLSYSHLGTWYPLTAAQLTMAYVELADEIERICGKMEKEVKVS